MRDETATGTGRTDMGANGTGSAATSAGSRAAAMLIMFPAVFLLTGAGRSFGVDGCLAGPLERASARGSRVARLVRWLV